MSSFTRADLISPGYAEMNRHLHEETAEFGTGGRALADTAVKLARLIGATAILDYGCGKGALKQEVTKIAPDIDVREYDPAIPGKNSLPKPAPLVCSFDVLEHIEPEKLGAVLKHMASVTTVAAYVAVHNGAAIKVLPDGRNAHLIQEGTDWWATKLSEHFGIAKINRVALAGSPTVVNHSLFLLNAIRR